MKHHCCVRCFLFLFFGCCLRKMHCPFFWPVILIGQGRLLILLVLTAGISTRTSILTYHSSFDWHHIHWRIFIVTIWLLWTTLLPYVIHSPGRILWLSCVINSVHFGVSSSHFGRLWQRQSCPAFIFGPKLLISSWKKLEISWTLHPLPPPPPKRTKKKNNQENPKKRRRQQFQWNQAKPFHVCTHVLFYLQFSFYSHHLAGLCVAIKLSCGKGVVAP